MNKTPKFNNFQVAYFSEFKGDNLVENFMLIALDKNGNLWIKKTIEGNWEQL